MEETSDGGRMTDEEVIELYIKEFFRVDPEDGVVRRGLKKIGLENFTTWREVITALYHNEDLNEAAKALHYGITRRASDNEDAPKAGMEGSLSKKRASLGMSWQEALGKDNNKAWPAHIRQSVQFNKCTVCSKILALENFKLLNEFNHYENKYKCDVYRNECHDCYKEKQAPRAAKWKKENGHIVNELSAKRRALKANTYELLSPEDKDKVREIYKECKSLNNDAGYIKYHVDHIRPLSKGGAHAPSNLQILLAEDNLKKGDKWDETV